MLVFLVKLKESKYQILAYSPKLPEPMVLILAKIKYRSLQRITYLASKAKAKHSDDPLVDHYCRLSAWVKLLSRLSQMLLDCLLGVVLLL